MSRELAGQLKAAPIPYIYFLFLHLWTDDQTNKRKR